MGLLDLFKKKTQETTVSSETKDKSVPRAFDYEIDDLSYIADVKHLSNGPWHQYDVILAARGYGWETILDWADYMATADLAHISKVSKAILPGANEIDVLDEYNKYSSFKKTPSLQEEGGVLSVGGMSKAIGGPMQIVWVNQSQLLRFFTITNDEILIRRYAETMIRRTFNTPDGMKLARPVEA